MLLLRNEYARIPRFTSTTGGIFPYPIRFQKFWQKSYFKINANLFVKIILAFQNIFIRTLKTFAIFYIHCKQAISGKNIRKDKRGSLFTNEN
jgi:hypothetical protein